MPCHLPPELAGPVTDIRLKSAKFKTRPEMCGIRTSFLPFLAQHCLSTSRVTRAMPVQMCDVPDFGVIWSAACAANIRGEGNAQQLMHAAMILQANVHPASFPEPIFLRSLMTTEASFHQRTLISSDGLRRGARHLIREALQHRCSNSNTMVWCRATRQRACA